MKIIYINDIKIKIYHSLITTDMEMSEYPLSMAPFKKLVKTKSEKFKKKFNRDYLICTVGMTVRYPASVIAIVLPFDDFTIKIAEKIVKGRLLRTIGQLKNKNGTTRKRYDIMNLPVYIYYGDIKEQIHGI